MFAQLKKKIEDKENANIPHVIISPSNIPFQRDQSDVESPGSGLISNAATTRTSKTSGDGKSKIPVLQDGLCPHNAEPVKEVQSEINYDEHAQAANEEKFKHCDGKEALVQQLQKEKVELERRLEEMQLQLSQFIHSKENSEELESFQAQELAKVKHLLLRSQQELSEKEEIICKLKGEAALALRHLSALRAEAETASAVELLSEKRSLENEVDKLKLEALRNSSILEVKEQSIAQLQERVAVLEKRLEDVSLPDDEMTKAVVEERTALEKKLEESHHQLTEIKTTWSEKIHSLEMQIFHLNKKMAEDSEDSLRLEKEVKELRETLSVQQEKLWSADEALKTKDEEARRVEERLRENEAQAKKQVKELENKVSNLVKEHQRQTQEEHARISSLIAAQSEHVERDIELERHVTQLEGENRRHKAEISKKSKECSSLKEEVTQLETQLSIVRQQVVADEEARKDCQIREKRTKDDLGEKQKRIQSLAEECDRLMMRNAELSQNLELLRRETLEEGSTRDKEKEDCDNVIYHLKADLEQANHKVEELEALLAINGDSSSKLAELTATVVEQEAEIAEKMKTIKLQQQRLADMKKALQKELKAQTDNSQADPKPGKDTGQLPSLQRGHAPEDDINFKYLKHVIFKFMTCSEYEGQHLVKAICALLCFTPEEERLIKETLEWKSSWFGIKPHHPQSRACPSS